MYEVDIENVEDLNELESRLYAQNHEETTEKQVNELVVDGSCGTTLPKSNWASGEINGVKKCPQQQHFTIKAPKQSTIPTETLVDDGDTLNGNCSDNSITCDKPHSLDPNSSNRSRQHGPVFKQQENLEKAQCVENKKQKSKKVSTKLTSPDVIDLLSSDESDGSDVVMVKESYPSTFIVDDSDDDDNLMSEITESTIWEEEENANVRMSSSQYHRSQPQSTPDCAEKDNSSHCTSPCSIQFSDDFIGNVARSLQLESASEMNDDEDILLLTSDTNSLMEAPQSVEHGHINPSTKDQPNQTEFRALDAYESESDNRDIFYSKETPKTTVIRKIDISSDDLEDITVVNVRTRRLRKRRASSSNKCSADANHVNTQSSTEDDECYNSGTERTGIPFILRGPAVERKIRKGSSTLSSCSTAPAIGKSSISKASTGNLSAGDYIAKVNNLVQGHNGENQAEQSDDDDNAPSAREIAEKILGENTSTVSTDTAVPKDVCNRINDVLSNVDIIEESEIEALAKDGEATTESDDLRCNDQQNDIVYKSVPNDVTAQINGEDVGLSDVWQKN